ncbi:MAG: hypothetical protein ACREQ5_04270 [Candidatus Dormibacteria bacterium]
MRTTLPEQTVIQPQTAAVTSPPFPTASNDTITVSADHLATTETVTLQFLANGVAKQVTDLTGTAVNLTASISGVVLEGGPSYVFVKSVTASACGVYVSPKIL